MAAAPYPAYMQMPKIPGINLPPLAGEGWGEGNRLAQKQKSRVAAAPYPAYMQMPKIPGINLPLPAGEGLGEGNKLAQKQKSRVAAAPYPAFIRTLARQMAGLIITYSLLQF
ncbi:hypothetical protein LJPFL01_1276 [Lelliottia jeotgali]|nr:hypothetical protein LJPFL01_1276 [Lelliottia jeotgali]